MALHRAGQEFELKRFDGFYHHDPGLDSDYFQPADWGETWRDLWLEAVIGGLTYRTLTALIFVPRLLVFCAKVTKLKPKADRHHFGFLIGLWSLLSHL